MRAWLPNKNSTNKMWSEYNESPYAYFCVVNKTKKQVTFMEGSVSPFKTNQVSFEDLKDEDMFRFSDDKKIEIKDYIND